MGCGTSTEGGAGEEDAKGSPYMKRADIQNEAEPETEATKASTTENAVKPETQNGHVEPTSEPEQEDDGKPKVPKGGILVMPLPPPMKPKYADTEGKMGEAEENGVVKRRNGSAGKPRVPTGGFLVMPDLAPEASPEDEAPAAPPAPIKPTQVMDLTDKRRTVVEDAESEDDDDDDEDLSNKTVILRESSEGLEMSEIGAEFDEEQSPPEVAEGEHWSDEDFTSSAAISGLHQEDLEWKRPSEFTSAPVLTSEGTVKLATQHGEAGICWYLTILAALGDLPQLLKQILPEGAYKSETGVFHCKLWSFGKQTDVYVDDTIPLLNGTPWGAHCTSDINVLWPLLLEKAMAKSCGSYKKLLTSRAQFSYPALTGGVVEDMKVKERKAKIVFQRIENALSSGALLLTSAQDNLDEPQGLSHSTGYIITGTAKVRHGSRVIPLLHLWTPLGSGLWTGAWAKQSKEWNEISEGTRTSLEDESEERFWISCQDYCHKFEQVHICNLTPDWDKEGTHDCLSHVTSIYGEWKEENAAGYEGCNKWRNPRYLVTVPETGPAVIQFQLGSRKKEKEENINTRVEVYKVLWKNDADDTKTMVLRDFTDAEFSSASQWSYRYPVESGEYLVIPTTQEAGQECQFLMKMFSAGKVDAAPFEEEANCFVMVLRTSFTYYKMVYKCGNITYLSGSWKSGVNAGGQISHVDSATNPQYIITILPGRDPEKLHPVCISLMQAPDTKSSPEPIGIKLFDLPMIFAPPIDQETLYKVNEQHTQRTVGQQDQVFVRGNSCDARYLLKEGRYLLLCHQDNPSVENAYVCAIASSEEVKIESFHTGS